MVRNVKTLEGKQYGTRKIRKIIVDEEDSDSTSSKNIVLKEKNRQSAQKSRDNKKKFIINLELRMAELETQNLELKERLRQSEQRVKFLESKFEHGNGNHMHVEKQIVEDCEHASDQTESGKDSFQRMSVRSFVSCGNFLMLAIIAVCCICSFYQPLGQNFAPRGFYSMKSLSDIMQRIKHPQNTINQTQQTINKIVSSRTHGFSSHNDKYTLLNNSNTETKGQIQSKMQ